MLAVRMPKTSCKLGSNAKNTTDTPVVTSIAMDVAYTCKAYRGHTCYILSSNKRQLT